MPGEVLGFPADDVHRHSNSVDALADTVDQARAAVHEVTMDTQAYGQLCQFLPGLLSPIFLLAVDALAETGESLRETATNLRSAVSATTATDATTADSIRQTTWPLGPSVPQP
ncbi:hypothetical protein [Micromonospora sp. NBC_01813]|uniref:hypothetical protein n=1 Tax=Micromonospora sp. NBC_01813 TaxID=2975988 RepID=UPI002DDC13A1|nr:hypothetical protein [Micromonospora sp. NBC_01813]WSA06641.1 hypothetical protein OG958_20360 [Micromonospora sp. NBC_01813]